MAEILYVKYNRTRAERFQIRTEIVRKKGKKYTRKTALCPEGRGHIQSFRDKYEALCRECEALHFAEPSFSRDGMTARFDFIEGDTLENRILAAVRAAENPKAALIREVRAAMGRIFAVRAEEKEKFAFTPEFSKVFNCRGDLSPEELGMLDGESFSASNIDSLFANMIVAEDGLYAIDYEWVILFPVPADFVRYRTLVYAYLHLSSQFGGLSREEFLDLFPELVTSNRELWAVYEKMEGNFQEYVHGENQRIYQEDYMVETKTAIGLAHVDEDLHETRERNDQLAAQIEDKNEELRKIREVQRLTQNHVANLTAMIADLRHSNEELAKAVDYYHHHLTLAFRARRKAGDVFNRKYPKGSAERAKLHETKELVFHPLREARLRSTEEGRNLLAGVHEIGEEYRTYGKLHFPAVEHPEVSIVIPCYNQVHYTYLCLRSILEHTKNVSYEVIIADDVSTDATSHLGDFAENLVICRNKVNQGFLRNCNNAAKRARGEFIMFLNNDTQVTDGWLESLVSLIRSDSSIGMVGSKLVYPDGRLQEAGGIIWDDGSGWNYGRMDDPEKPEYNYVKDVDYISGAAILLSRSLWKEIGGFDERFAPAYCEDSDLAFEVRRHGKRVVYQPLSKVIHFEGISNGTDVQGTGLKRYQVENSRKLREKWAEELKKQCHNDGNPNPFLARERSQGRQVILVIDHYVPTFDRDAGSKTTFQYLKMFLHEGFRVKFLGDNFAHEEPYTTTLTQMGIEVLYGSWYQAGFWDWLDKNGKYISFAYLNRPHIATKYVDYLSEHTDIKMIYYGHDLHFLRLYREYELSGDTRIRRESAYWKSVEFSLMRRVSISYYPSQVEIDAIHAVDPTIRAKAITAYVYEKFLDQINEDYGKREGLLFVGGFAHPPNADGVLWFVKNVWPMIREKLKINFYIVGSHATEEIEALNDPENGVVVKGFVSEEELAALYQNTRIVVVPLRYGAGVKGKVVEAIYNGAAIVTTSVGSEGIPEVESVLRVEDEPEDFAAEVVRLYQDPAELVRLSRATQAYIRSHFSTEAAWNVIREDFTREDNPKERQG